MTEHLEKHLELVAGDEDEGEVVGGVRAVDFLNGSGRVRTSCI